MYSHGTNSRLPPWRLPLPGRNLVESKAARFRHPCTAVGLQEASLHWKLESPEPVCFVRREMLCQKYPIVALQGFGWRRSIHRQPHSATTWVSERCGWTPPSKNIYKRERSKKQPKWWEYRQFSFIFHYLTHCRCVILNFWTPKPWSTGPTTGAAAIFRPWSHSNVTQKAIEAPLGTRPQLPANSIKHNKNLQISSNFHCAYGLLVRLVLEAFAPHWHLRRG